jgi:hypothetical protein
MSTQTRWSYHRSNASYQRARISVTGAAGGDAASSIHRLNPDARQGPPILIETGARPTSQEGPQWNGDEPPRTS